ncbi:hypothetical protein [Streptomyces sp. NBC_00038]|uniref:hypothetical protein n=1 Tax=Streptomyces sp. NBC_00038 TaxID=2903615 RepID=UPI002259EECA|nr:hypothetical protein [Streptomyces sp. NBC_00038]MCX5554691.1 hypothetical protein [Streptomyces sp. NBC_00038]
MRTTLTPEFYQLFAVLLVAAMGVTFVVAAVADALLVRLLRRLHTCRQATLHRRHPGVGSSTRPVAHSR